LHYPLPSLRCHLRSPRPNQRLAAVQKTNRCVASQSEQPRAGATPGQFYAVRLLRCNRFAPRSAAHGVECILENVLVDVGYRAITHADDYNARMVTLKAAAAPRRAGQTTAWAIESSLLHGRRDVEVWR